MIRVEYDPDTHELVRRKEAPLPQPSLWWLWLLAGIVGALILSSVAGLPLSPPSAIPSSPSSITNSRLSP